MVAKLENRSLDRAITILEVLARDAPCSLHQLHEQTALPKSTIRRLVGTLTKRRFIRRSIGDGLYRTNIALHWANNRRHTTMAARLVEVAQPHMRELTKSLGWPSNLAIYKTGRMQVIESTRSLSPLNMDFMDKLKVIDRECSLFGSGLGLAYLSALDTAGTSRIIDMLQDDPEWGFKRFGIDKRTLAQELQAIRKAGYAVRRAGYGERHMNWKSNGIALPIIAAFRPIGALNLQWRRSYTTPDRFARRYLSELRRAADAISADFAKPGEDRVAQSPSQKEMTQLAQTCRPNPRS